MPALADKIFQFNARLHVSAPAIVDRRPVVDRPFPRVPGIQRIGLVILLEIFKVALSVSDKTAVEDVLSALPRGYLGLVCKAWHRLILKHPSLWATIVVHPHSYISQGSWENVPFATYLLRSHDRPLSIYIIPAQSQRGSGGSKGVEWALADVVSKVGKRIQSLVVEARWKSSLDRLGNVLDAQLYPVLKRLSINAAIDDAGPSDVIRLTTTGRWTLTTLSIDAKHLLTLLSSFQNFNLHRPLDRLASLTIIDVLPINNASGFPEGGMGRIIDLANSLPRLSSLTFNRFIVFEGSLESKHWRRRSPAPLPICLVTVKNSKAAGIKYLLHHLAPKKLTLDACKFTTTSIIRLPACIDSLTLCRIGGMNVELSVLPMVASFVGSHLVIRDCAFFTHHFLHLVHGRAYLNLFGFAFPGLRRLHIEHCPRMRADELLDFLAWRSSKKATQVAEGSASGQKAGERTH